MSAPASLAPSITLITRRRWYAHDRYDVTATGTETGLGASWTWRARGVRAGLDLAWDDTAAHLLADSDGHPDMGWTTSEAAFEHAGRALDALEDGEGAWR